jgi:phosphatidylglycerophosphate synthase
MAGFNNPECLGFGHAARLRAVLKLQFNPFPDTRSGALLNASLLSLRARTGLTCLGALVVVVCVSVGARHLLALGSTYPVKVATLFTAIAAAMLTSIGAAHPFHRFGLANHITTVRAMIVALLGGALLESAGAPIMAAATAASLAALLLDGFDGWLARRTRLSSAFGARFDLETDALLILVLSLMAWRFGKAGAWVVWSGALRYAFLAAGALFPWMTRPLYPSRRRQTICVLQVTALIVVVSPFTAPPFSSAIALSSLALLGISFAIDTVWLFGRSQRLHGCGSETGTLQGVAAAATTDFTLIGTPSAQ